MQLIIDIDFHRVALRACHRRMWIVYLELLVEEEKRH